MLLGSYLITILVAFIQKQTNQTHFNNNLKISFKPFNKIEKTIVQDGLGLR